MLLFNAIQLIHRIELTMLTTIALFDCDVSAGFWIDDE